MSGYQPLPVAWGAGREVGLLDAQVLEKQKNPFLNGKLCFCNNRGASRI